MFYFFSYGSYGIVIEPFLAVVGFVLWTPPSSCFRVWNWESYCLELYISVNTVQIGQFASSLHPSVFLNLTPFRYPFLGATRGKAVPTPPLPLRNHC